MPSKALALSAQAASSGAIAPWQVGSDQSWKAADATKLTCSSLPSGPISEPRVVIHSRSSGANEQTTNTSVAVLLQLPEDSAPTHSLMQDSSVELSEGHRGGPDIAMKAVTSPNDSDAQSIRASSGLADSTADRASTGSNAGVPASIAHAESNPIIFGISAVGHAAPSHEMRTADGRDDPSVGPRDRAVDCSIEAGGQPQLSAATQAEQDAASSSSTIATSWNLNSVSEVHRGAAHTNEIIMDTTLSAPQRSRVDSTGGLGPNTSLQGHSGALNSNHPESIQEAAPAAQLREPMLARSADENVARLLGSAMRGDLRVGVQTEAFGHVTIQANAQGGQLSAQLSVENAKESAMLAAHLPAAEHRLTQQHGVIASVRLAGGFGGTAGGFTGREQSESNRRNSGPYIAMRSGQTKQGSLNEGRGVESAVKVSRHFVTSRLDVTV